MRKLPIGGLTRSFILFAPQALPESPALVLVLHGRGGDGAAIERYTQGSFDRLAESEGFVVVYPDALGRVWNSGHAYAKSEIDDVAFLTALVETLTREFHADPKRVYVTGYSNGASMTYRFACERSDRIAAIAPVAGGLAERQMRPCAAASSRPIPLLVMHGTADTVNTFDSGELEGNVQYWIRRNGCELKPVVSRLADTEADGTHTRVESYENCRNGADVVLYAIEGGEHRWPGGDEPFRFGQSADIRDFDAGIVIWDFFREHPMPATE